MRDNLLDRRDVAMQTTLYTFAQYFGWREILREEIQFLDLRREEETREINALMGKITQKFATDSLGDRFLLWKAEQRAIGEAMIGDWYGRPVCIGYLEFLNRRDVLAPLLSGLRDDIEHTSQEVQSQRLTEVQHLLIGLIRRLDPAALPYDDVLLRPLPA